MFDICTEIGRRMYNLFSLISHDLIDPLWKTQIGCSPKLHIFYDKTANESIVSEPL